MRNFRKYFFILLLIAAAISGRVWLEQRRVVPILMFHKVEKTNTPQAEIVSPQRFDWQMGYLKKNHYNVISLDTLVDAIRDGKKLPPKPVVITFDDGYADNYVYALPVLKKYGFPATVFIVPGLVDQNLIKEKDYLDPEKFKALIDEDYLNWAQIREMMKGGFTIGCHGLTSAYLPDLSIKNQVLEIEKGKWALENTLKVKIDLYAYPVGGFDENTKAIVKQAGFKAAVTTNRGKDRFNKNLYELDRIRISDADNSEQILWVKLMGFYHLFRQMENPH